MKLSPALAGFALVLSLGAEAHAQPKPVVIASDAPNDGSKAYDLVFVSEGYLASEQDAFLQDARVAAQHVARDPEAAPLRAVRPFNFHFVFVPSTAPGASFQQGAAPFDTPFKAHVDASGWLAADDAAADTAAAVAPDVDGVVILVKFADGAPWQRSNADVIPAHTGRVRLTHDSLDALIHELGHTIGGLGDEYTELDREPTEDEKSSLRLFPNLSLDGTGARWRSVVSTVVEGGGRFTKGVYKAEPHCRMNESTSEEFCSVCKAAIAKPRVASDPALSVSVTDGIATWRPGATLPTAWWIQVEKHDGWSSYTMIRKFYVEPQQLSVDVSDLPPGDYVFAIFGETMAGSSGGAQTDFTIKARPAPSAARPVTNAAPPAAPPSATPGVTGSISR